MKAVLAVLLTIFIASMGYQVYEFYIQKKDIEKQYLELQAKAKAVETDNQKIGKDIEYYSNEANLEKQGRSDLNYRLPDEKMIIVLKEIVENTIIHQDVKRRLGSSFDDIVDNKIKDLSGSEALKKAASTLYGLTLADFIDLFIKPAAERELLDGKLLLEKTTFDDWFKEAKKNASVTLLVSGFFWNGDGVEVK